MLGAIYGDIIGSYYEVHQTKNILVPESTFTDDTFMTAAVSEAMETAAEFRKLYCT